MPNGTENFLNYLKNKSIFKKRRKSTQLTIKMGLSNYRYDGSHTSSESLLLCDFCFVKLVNGSENETKQELYANKENKNHIVNGWTS